MLYHITVFDAEATDPNVGRAAHFDQYTAMLMATYSMYAPATSQNFLTGSYGALESFTAPDTLQGLMDYLTETGYTVQVQTLPIELD